MNTIPAAIAGSRDGAEGTPRPARSLPQTGSRRDAERWASGGGYTHTVGVLWIIAIGGRADWALGRFLHFHVAVCWIFIIRKLVSSDSSYPGPAPVG